MIVLQILWKAGNLFGSKLIKSQYKVQATSIMVLKTLQGDKFIWDSKQDMLSSM